tara:strand:- start:381 stop:713 length:333 start_codon:yes stop_codon:yes gene_type:complete
MQVHFVESRGVRAVTYERWVHLDEHHGTYVRMEIDDDGAWLQVHEPTNLRVPLRFPGDTDFLDAGDSKDHNFELERLLTLDSPGVKRTPNPVEIYRPITTGDDGWIVRTP